MKTYLIFDTETTGFLRKDVPPGHELQPHVVQLAAELHDGERVLAGMNLIVDPGVPIPEQASSIHGITDAMAKRYGVRPVVAIALFNNLAKLASKLVAHNAPFDVGVVTGEYLRLDRQAEAFDRPVVCTMLASTPILKIPKPGRYRSTSDPYKWPNLQEAYQFFVDPAGFDGAHDAMEDVRACRKILFEMIKRGCLCEEP